MATVYEERATVFKALCDARRQRILELLHSGEKCACVLIDEIGFVGIFYNDISCKKRA